MNMYITSCKEKEITATTNEKLRKRVNDELKVGQDVYLRTMEGEAGEKLNTNRSSYMTKWTIECFRKTKKGDVIHESFSNWEIICNK